jgi:hypothetical protein
VTYSGLFKLQTANDLLGKLRHDLGRIENDWLDQYAAFDFFITAFHVVDWLYPGDAKRQRAEIQGSPLLQVCSHLANRSKHFQATDPQHRSVTDTKLHEAQFSQQFSEQFAISRLEIHLTVDAATELGVAVTSVPRLARQVLPFWEAHPAL